jgi:outer membrane protein assembly factor BamB
LVILQWLVIIVPGMIAPGTMMQFYAIFMGSMLSALAIVLWWLFASRVRWLDRIAILLLIVGIGAGMFMLYDPTFGLFGVLLYVLRILTTVWVGWLVLTWFLPWPARRAGLVVACTLVWAFFTLIRFDGVSGSMKAETPWRWAPTNEDLFHKAKEGGNIPMNLAGAAADAQPVVLKPGDWPAFRGPNRDGRLGGVKLAANWDKKQPKLLWKYPVGPGWSSFAVIGHRVYTQMQWEKDKEAVVCYHADTGSVLWVHTDDARFEETVGGNGPRATPTFFEGKIYALGAKGNLNCLDAAAGKLLWARDITKDTEAKVPIWGFASSPLISHGLVMVFAGGPNGKSVVAYNVADGGLAWYGGKGLLSYCSPQPAKLDGIDQVLISTDQGLLAFQPDKGNLLWEHEWPTENMPRIVQPAVVSGGDVLVASGLGMGTRRVKVTQSSGAWTDSPVWTTKKFSAYFNDFVVYQDHLYGFNNEFFSCVSLKDGKLQWKERGYGCGQVLLLEDQGMLLIASEEGDVALTEATPDELREKCRFRAIEGKTWNHPVIAHGKLFVRNSQEMACFAIEELSPK